MGQNQTPSRCLKFRVWNRRTKKWIHGPGQEVNLFGECILLGGFLDGTSIMDLNNCVALQYTNRKDKNNKEIYEGDVIRIVDTSYLHDRIPEVTIRHAKIGWYEEGAFWTEYLDWFHTNAGVDDGKPVRGWIPRSENIEVVGNIFEGYDKH